MAKAKQKALITGGAGFIGSHLSEYLLKRGWDVTIIDDLSTGRFGNIEHLTKNPRFHVAIDSIANETVMDRLVSECDLVFHLAAAVGVQLIVQDAVRTIETNISGSEMVLKVANRYRKKVLIASTSEVYGKTNKTPFREDDDMVLGPTSKSRWSYACSKAIDEFLALAYHKKYDLPVVIVRLFNTVGPRQTGAYGMVIPRFVTQAVQGEDITIYGDGKQSRCFGNVEDVVKGIVALALEPRAVGQVFNLGATSEISIEDLARRVIAITKSNSKLVYVPYDQAYESGFEDMRRRVPDISKAGKLVGYRPRVTLDETIRRVAAHVRTELATAKRKRFSAPR
jgi:UDP-glucose 4-epimerase